MSNDNALGSPTKGNTLNLFIFIAGVLVSAASLAISVELLIKNLPHGLEHIIAYYDSQLLFLGKHPSFLDFLSLKITLYKEVLALRVALWSVPVSILSLTVMVIVLSNRNSITEEFVRRYEQQRKILMQERKRKKHALIQLEQSEEHLYKIHEQLREAFMVISKDERVRHLNRVAVQMLSAWNNAPKSARHYAEQPVEAFVRDYNVSGFGLCVKDAITKKLAWQKEVELESLGVWLQIRVFPTDGDEVYVYMHDITEEKRPGRLKELGDNILKTVAETSPYAIAVMDRQWNYVVVSQKWREDFGFADEELAGQNHKALLPRLPGKWQAIEQQLISGKSVKSEGMPFQFNGKDERVKWELFPWIMKGNVQGFVMYANFVTDIFHVQEKLEQQSERERKLAYHDILTGLPNRQLFYDRLTMSLAHAYRNLGKVALFFLDLDGFKGINDNLGHDIGDMLLKEVAVRLKRCVRDSDTVARLGGDEFTIILNGVQNADDAMHVAQKIIKSINEVFLLGRHEVYVSTSIGISLYPDDGSTTAELIKKADTAMYWSKEGGKNQANFFNKDLNDGEQKTSSDAANKTTPATKGDVTSRELESHIRVALKKDEIEVFYQPIFHEPENTAFALEALVRWRHPEAGLLEPAKFLNIAENTGIILPIGNKILEDVVEKMKTWKAKSAEPLVFSINLSTRQLKDESLIQRIQSAFNDGSIALSNLALEINEKVVEEGDEVVVSTISQLNALGCKIIIDGFGKSYASTKLLEGLNIYALKVSKEIVQGASISTEDKASLKSIATLGKNLGVKVIADGVEDEAQMLTVQECGIHDIQGFVLSKPSKPKELFDLFLRD